MIELFPLQNHDKFPVQHFKFDHTYNDYSNQTKCSRRKVIQKVIFDD